MLGRTKADDRAREPTQIYAIAEEDDADCFLNLYDHGDHLRITMGDGQQGVCLRICKGEIHAIMEALDGAT